MYGEPIKIQFGSIFMNRTRKYLFPVLKAYGSDFSFKINSLVKVAVGIGDVVVNRCGIQHENHLFILVDTLPNHSQFVSLLDDIRRHEAYEDDYVYGNILNSRFHMIVVRVPDNYLNSFDNFKRSQYSKMYSDEDLSKLFLFNSGEVSKEYKDIRHVLIKDHNYKFEFAKLIQKEFDIPEFNFQDIDDSAELDFQILDKEEVFNASLLQSTQNEEP